MLPPCVEAMLSDFKPEYAPIIASYYKTYEGSEGLAIAKLMRKANNIETVRKILDAWQDAPRFECTLVRSAWPDLCAPELCPLVSDQDPVELAKKLVERIVYVEDTDELIIFFQGGKSRFITQYLQAMRNPKGFASDFRAKVLQVFNIDVDLRPHKDPDTGEVINPADQFLVWLIRSAEQVSNYDTYGIGDLLLELLAREPVFTQSEARYEPDARLIVKEHGGKYALYIDANYFRMRLRPLVGPKASNARAINALLARYDIRNGRIQVAGERRPVYIISEEVFERLTGQKLIELLGAKVSDMDTLLSAVGVSK